MFKVVLVLIGCSALAAGLWSKHRTEPTPIPARADSTVLGDSALAIAGPFSERIEQTTNMTDVWMLVGDLRVYPDTILWGIDSRGGAGYAYVSGALSSGAPFVFDNTRAYPTVSSVPADLVGSFLPSQIAGERRLLEEIGIAREVDGRLFFSYIAGTYDVSGRSFVLDYEAGTMQQSLCCKIQLGITSCEPDTCGNVGGGYCGDPPSSCACIDGPGLCVSPVATMLCYASFESCCGTCTCAHWINPQGVEKCNCRCS